MHKTYVSERVKTLKAEARKLERHARATMKAADILPDASLKARELEEQAEKLKAEAEALNGSARLDDLSVWVMEKNIRTIKKGTRTYLYWMASWREGGKARNVHLGSCGKMDRKTALQKARKLKAEALAKARRAKGKDLGINTVWNKVI